MSSRPARGLIFWMDGAHIFLVGFENAAFRFFLLNPTTTRTIVGAESKNHTS